MPMTNAWRIALDLEVGDETAGGLPAAGRAVRLQQVGGAGPEPDRVAVAHVGVHIRMEHLPAGHGLQEALAGQAPPRGLQTLVDDLVLSPVAGPRSVGVVSRLFPVA